MQVFKSKWLSTLLTVAPKVKLKQKREGTNIGCLTLSVIAGCQMGQVLRKTSCMTASSEAESSREGRELGGGAGATAGNLTPARTDLQRGAGQKQQFLVF